MRKDAVDPILRAIDAAIVEAAMSDHVGKYAEVAKLCGHADKIRHMAAIRVEEIASTVRIPGGEGGFAGDNDADEDLVGPNPYVPRPMMGGRLGVQPLYGAHNDLFADNMRMVADLLKEHVPKPDPKPFFQRNKADELSMLLHTRSQLVEAGKPPDVLDRQIDQLLAAIDAEKATPDGASEPNPNDSNVVRALVLGGHPPRGEGREHDDAGHGRSDQRREGSAEEARGVGAEEEVDREGLDSGNQRIERHEGADRQGGQGAATAPETRPSDGERGEVLRRQDGGDRVDGDPGRELHVGLGSCDVGDYPF